MKILVIGGDVPPPGFDCHLSRVDTSREGVRSFMETPDPFQLVIINRGNRPIETIRGIRRQSATVPILVLCEADDISAEMQNQDAFVASFSGRHNEFREIVAEALVPLAA